MSEKARIAIDDPAKTFGFECGCKVSAATRVDGQLGFALATCDAGMECPSAKIVIATAHEDSAGGRALVEECELADEIVGGPPPDQSFECGCRAVFGFGEGGEKTAYWYACDAGPRCPNTTLFMDKAKAAAAEHPEKKFEVRVLKTKH